MQKSDSIAALAAALAKAQSEMGTAKKAAINPHFRSRYADLASVWEAARTPLAKNGLAVIQTSDDSERGACIITTLVHSSGEWISGRLTLPVSKADAQGYGSAITYARRYGLSAILGIAADDDDDGNAATRSVDRPSEPAATTTGPARDWGAFARDAIARIDNASTSEAITAVAKEVHLAKPPKAQRDLIAEAYSRKVALLSAESAS